jgi:hypothetical protein
MSHAMQGVKVGFLGISFLFLLWGSAGCCSYFKSNRKISERLSGADFSLRFLSEGGFGPEEIVARFTDGKAKPISIKSRVGVLSPVEQNYPLGHEVGKKLQAIRKSGVLDLPAELRKEARPGRDFPRITMEFKSATESKRIVRDYHYGGHFEPAFHCAEKLFLELAGEVKKGPRTE